MQSSNDDQFAFWYYQVDGKRKGPVSVSRLRQLARVGQLTSTDLISKGSVEVWVSAGAVHEIGEIIRGRTSEEVAKTQQLAAKQATLSQPDIPPTSSTELIFDLLSELRRIAIDRKEMFRRIVGCLAFVAVLVFFVRTVLNRDFGESSLPKDPLTTYESLWRKLQAHRRARIDDDTWTEFSERGRQEINSVVAVLERQAGASNRESQLLLWAGRDFLAKMIQSDRIAPSPLEQEFVECLDNVKQIRAGVDPYGSNRDSKSNRIADTLWPFGRGAFVDNATLVLTGINFALVSWLVHTKLKRGPIGPL